MIKEAGNKDEVFAPAEGLDQAIVGAHPKFIRLSVNSYCVCQMQVLERNVDPGRADQWIRRFWTDEHCRSIF